MGRTLWLLFGATALLALTSCHDDNATVPSPIESEFVWAVGNLGLIDGQMYRPRALALDPATENVYVLDDNRNVHVFSSLGVFQEQFGVSVSLNVQDMAFTNSGTFLVTNVSDGFVYEFEKDGTRVRSWGGPGQGPGELDRPTGIAVGGNGWVYVADSLNDRVQVFDSEGNFLKSFGGPGSNEGQFSYPYTIAINDAGQVYVGDWTSRIQKFDADGNWITSWGKKGSEDGSFIASFFLAVTELGDVLALEPSQRVQRFSSDGVFISSWPGEGYAPSSYGAIEVSPTGVIYTLGLRNFGVQAYTPEGQLLNEFGTPIYSAPLQFNDAITLAATRDGSVLIGSQRYGPPRIQHLDRNGTYVDEWQSTATHFLVALAAGANGAMYVLGYDDYYDESWTLVRLSSDGNVIGTWGVPKDSRSLTADEAGHVWLIDQANTRILAYTKDGTQHASWGEMGVDPGKLLKPVSVAVAGGNVAVCDSKAIALFSETGAFKRNLVTFYQGQPRYNKIALNDDNVLFATSEYADSVSMFDLSGTPLGGLHYYSSMFRDMSSGPHGELFLLTNGYDLVVKFHVQ